MGNSHDIEVTMDMLEVSVKRFTQEISEQIEDGIYKPVLGLGRAGIGKTQSIKALAKELGIGYIEMRLVNFSETDIKGIPDYEEIKVTDDEGHVLIDEDGKPIIQKATTYATNTLLPNKYRDEKNNAIGEDGKKKIGGLLVFDEITSASGQTRAAVLQLLDGQRKIANYDLPEGWKIICLGNGIEDGGEFVGMTGAFLTRGAGCFRVMATYDDWREWAVSNGIHPAILAFLDLHNADYFYTMQADVTTLFACPRSWEALSDILKGRERRMAINAGEVPDENGNVDTSNVVLSPDSVRVKACGAVGMQVGEKFAAFYKYKEDIKVNPRAIVAGKAVKESGSLGSRVFELIEPLDLSDKQVFYLGVTSISKSFEESFGTLTPEDYVRMSPAEKHKIMEPVMNVAKWIIALRTGSQGNMDNVKIAYDLIFVKSQMAKKVLIDPEFRRVFPEYIALVEAYTKTTIG